MLGLLAILGGAYLFGRKHKGVRGVGATSNEEWYIVRWSKNSLSDLWNIEAFEGFRYDNRYGEKWASWCNPYNRWAGYPKEYKTRKGAEKALNMLTEMGETESQYGEVRVEILPWEKFRKYTYYGS